MATDPAQGNDSSEPADPTPVDRLKNALAAMFGRQQSGDSSETPAQDEPERDEPTDRSKAAVDTCPICPRTILEAMLFVGHPDNEALSAEEAASLMRGVEPEEVERLVDELNTAYEADAAAYEIESSAEGYRLVLRGSFDRTREKFYGRLRQARLSKSAIEVLSIVAYHQPTTLEQVEQLRNSASGAILSQLVRRQLVRLERPQERPRRPFYYTTDRFLRLFGLSSLEDLPECEDLKPT